MPTNQLLQYPVAEENMPFQKVIEAIEHDLKIPAREQEILLMSGTSPDPKQPALIHAGQMVSSRKVCDIA